MLSNEDTRVSLPIESDAYILVSQMLVKQWLRKKGYYIEDSRTASYGGSEGTRLGITDLFIKELVDEVLKAEPEPQFEEDEEAFFTEDEEITRDSK
jgi:hypothetical protein